MKKLQKDDFSVIWGMPRNAVFLTEGLNLQYRQICEEERDDLICQILQKLDKKEFSVAGERAIGKWEKGWEEVLEDFKDSGYKLEALIPQYFRKESPARLFMDFVMPLDSWKFEVGTKQIFTSWLFGEFFSNVDVVYEFGCGSGMYLAKLAQMFPQKEFHGLDWASSSVSLIDEIGKRYDWNMKGHRFDMFRPDFSFKLKPKSGVLLFSALEQLGTNFMDFLDYLIAQKPSIVVIVDTIYEWYDPRHLTDYLVIKFMQERNYLRGFVDELTLREKREEVEILKAHRSLIGSLYIEGHSYIVWRPHL